MIDPDTLRILGDRILVRRYERPEETPGGIVIPESARADLTGTLWEFISGEESAYADHLGVSLQAGDILRTRQDVALFIGDGFWLLRADAIEAVLKW